MALRFKCEKCGEYIITKFLKVGEVAKCRNCGAENVIPRNALETDEEPKDIIPTGTEPKMVEKTNGKVRPFESVLIFSIITLSIYFWVYLFKTVQEVKRTFTFDAHETNSDKVRSLLIAYLIVSILVAIINEATGWPYRAFAYPSETPRFYGWLVISNIIETALLIAFWASFVRLIGLCQKKGGMVPLNKFPFWTLIAINAVPSFVYIAITSLKYLVPVILVDLVVSLIFLYLIVKQVNRIWTESHGVGMS